MADENEELLRLPNPDVEAYRVLREIGMPRLQIYREDLREKGRGDLRGTEGPGARLLSKVDRTDGRILGTPLVAAILDNDCDRGR